MCKRYDIQARKKTQKTWSEWTSADYYAEAEEHLHRIKELGYDGQIVPSNEVTALWDLLGKDQTPLVEAILDAGFALRREAVKTALVRVKLLIRRKGVKIKDKKYLEVSELYEILNRVLKDVGAGESLED